jgi:hypothetical protein
MASNKISGLKIILVGQLMINLPVTIVIIMSAILLAQLGLGWTLSVILGTGIGWYVWGILLDKWKNWALDKGVERERLFRLGKLGLLNFYRYRIFDDTKLMSKNKPLFYF